MLALSLTTGLVLSTLNALPLPVPPALAAPAATAAALRFGPPLLCHPFVIGAAESLPWGTDAFAVPADLSPSKAAVISLEILAEGDELIVQLETVRRAVIALVYRHTEDAEAVATADRWLAVLAGRREHLGLLAELERGKGLAQARADHGRASLHLAVAHEALNELGVRRASERQIERWIDEALTLLPGDGAAQLAATLVGYAQGDEQRWQTHLAQTLQAARGDALLAANLTATMGPCLGAKDLDGLAAQALARR